MTHLHELSGPADTLQQAPSPVPPEWHKPALVVSEDTTDYATAVDAEPSYADPVGGGFVGEDVADLEFEGEETELTYDLEADATYGTGSGLTGIMLDIENEEPVQAASEPPHEADATPDTPSGARDGGDDVPPEGPDIPIGETGPNPGEALRTVLTVAADSLAEIENRLSEAEASSPEQITLREYLEGHGVDLGEAGQTDEVEAELARSYDLRAENTLPRGVVADYVAEANNAHSQELAAAGVEFKASVVGPISAEGITLTTEMTNPDAYTEAVGQIGEVDERLGAHIEYTVGEAVNRASNIIARSHLEARRQEQGDQASSAEETGFPPVSPDEQAFANSLTRNAGQLAENLNTAAAPLAAIEPLEQLELARAEGLGLAWAVGVQYDLVGASREELGVERLESRERWVQVLTYAQELHGIAPPGSEFARQVITNLATDMRTTLDTFIDPYNPVPAGHLLDIKPVIENALHTIRDIWPELDLPEPPHF